MVSTRRADRAPLPGFGTSTLQVPNAGQSTIFVPIVIRSIASFLDLWIHERVHDDQDGETGQDMRLETEAHMRGMRACA